MKNLTKENLKRTLGMNIDEYLRNNNIKRTAFAEMVNEVLGIENGDDDSNYKKVSRWITGENVPDTLTMVAISEIIGFDICELFKKEISFANRIKDLSKEEKRVLYEILIGAKGEGLTNSAMYLPVEFNGKRIESIKSIYNRKEILDIYASKSEPNFRDTRMNDFFITFEHGFMKLDGAETHFSRFCNVKFVESKEDDYVEPILYNNREEYYEKIASIWKDFPGEDFYNVIFFEERSYEYEEEPFDMDKANYFKARVVADEVFNQKFGKLIELGLIKEANDQPFSDEFDDGTIVSGIDKMGRRINVFVDTDSGYGYTTQCRGILFTICFNFSVNMTSVEINELIKSIKENN